ncbi:hypothetical protein BD413DRAFT_537416 [Trametes elegans]|nr:hypothetical protein BD413DRAFT_537416 [Trametes elegans]
MLFFPLPGTYAVAELDVSSTLRPLDDPVAEEAAANIRATKCLIYMDIVLQLPFPDSPTFKYMVHLVGPGLRPANPELCTTPDMCIPIFPNTSHPSGTRHAIKPNPPFPFSNCCQWIGPDMQLDLRILNEGRDYRPIEKTALPADQRVKMEFMRGDDMDRRICTWAEQNPLPPGQDLADNASALDKDTGSSEFGADSNVDCALEPSRTHIDELASQDGAGNDSPVSHSGGEGDDAQWEGSEYTGSISVQSFPHEIWLDIGAHFKEEDVPNPADFIERHNTLVRIVQESKTRTQSQAADQAASHRNKGEDRSSSTALRRKHYKSHWYRAWTWRGVCTVYRDRLPGA